MKRKFRLITSLLAVLLAVALVSGCGGSGNSGGTSSGSAQSETVSENTSESKSEAAEISSASETAQSSAEEYESEIPAEHAEIPEDAPEIDGLVFAGQEPLEYAEEFAIYRYEDGYSCIVIPTVGNFLIVPEGGEVPSGLSDEFKVLCQPVNKIYMAATSSMSLVVAIDGLDNIRLSSLRASGWYVPAAAEAMNEGSILFAGKYSEPDYETMIDENCDLAIESRMIYHTPKVMEMIEDLGIPVLVDNSSNESHPLGRAEWIKMYGAIIGKDAEAKEYFDAQASVVKELKEFENTGKTVVFFNINSDGSAVIRTPTDYVAKMIDIAGGRYLFDDYETNVTSSTFHISMEEFYSKAVDADYLVYNGSIAQPLSSIADLLAKDPLFEDFKAVKEGQVYTTGLDFYQSTDRVGDMIRDFNIVVTDGNLEDMVFIKHVE